MPLQRLNTHSGEEVSLVRRRAVTSPNCTVRVVVMGAQAVGKTSIINGYMHRKLVEDYSAVVGSLPADTEERLKLEILDTDGLLITSMRRLAIRTAHAFVLVYAVDDEESFDYITDLRNEIIEMKGEDVPIVVVGNKADMESRQIHPAVADCVVSIDWDCEYFECSAIDNYDVSGIFARLLSHPNLDRQFGNNSPQYRKTSLPANNLTKSESSLKYKGPVSKFINRLFAF